MREGEGGREEEKEEGREKQEKFEIVLVHQSSEQHRYIF